MRAVPSMPYTAFSLVAIALLCFAYHTCFGSLGVFVSSDYNPKALMVQVSKNCSTTDDIAPENNNRTVLCSRGQIRNGQWLPKILHHVPYTTTYESKICGLYEGQHHNSTFLSYEWLPNDHETCTFLPWSRGQFCQALQNETIVMMGDSLAKEQHVSLGGLLGIGDHLHAYGNRLACNETVRVIFRRSDYLEPKRVQWELTNAFPKYALLNRGAHYVGDALLIKEINETIGYVQEWQAKCKEHDRDCHLLWRTTVPGHPLCMNYKKPVINLTEMEEMVSNNGLAKYFNWTEFKHQNELIVDLLRTSGISFSIVDAYEINLVRPDGHIKRFDCLHSCLGSKVDVLSQVMVHLIKLHQDNGNDGYNDGKPADYLPKCDEFSSANGSFKSNENESSLIERIQLRFKQGLKQ